MSSPYTPDYGYPERGIVELEQAIKRVCPIDGVSVGRWEDRATWRIDLQGDVTKAQRAAALEVVAEFELQDVYENIGAPRVIR